MRTTKIITEGQHENSVDRSDNLSDWLSKFADEFEKNSKTAVEVARDRMQQISIQDQMNAIMSGSRPRFSSVEEAVEHYQQETGLMDYAKQAQKTRSIKDAAKIIMAAEETPSPKANSRIQALKSLAFESGISEDKAAELVDQIKSLVSEMGDEKEEAPENESLSDALQELASQPDEDEDENLEEEIKAIFTDEDDTEDDEPEIFAKHPDIKVFIGNITRTPGIQVPAVLKTIQELFSRQILPSDLDDVKLYRYIDKRRQPAKEDSSNANLGLDLGTQRDFIDELQNRNPWGFAQPARMT